MWQLRARHEKNFRSKLRTMRLLILLCQFVLILQIEAQIPPACSSSTTNRAPENSDIEVICGTKYINLSIYLCPMYQARYNESLMVLNDQVNTPECYGTADWTVDPPVLRFQFPLNTTEVTACNNNFKIVDQVGSGAFHQISKVQYVNVSGVVNSIDPSLGTITYLSQILYKFSCFYPMQYLLNNTELAVSGVNLAIRDNNGSFVSTLSLGLYEDQLYTLPLNIPPEGLNLKTKIYVAVKATNLTDSFHLLLDRCYATTSPLPGKSTYYDLFVGCNQDPQTHVSVNGLYQYAHFSFEAFRFTEHKNQTISTFYLHCVTRLCEKSACKNFLPDCSANRRRRREAQQVSDNATVSSPAIHVGRNTIVDAETFSAPYGASPESQYSSPVVAVIVCIVILTVLLVAMAAYFVFYIRRRKL